MVSGQADRERETPYRLADEHLSARSRDHRYILYSNGEEELYDHRTDLFEWHNLAGQAKHAAVKAELRRELLRVVGGTSLR
jgi:hypothetical protein